LLLQLYSQDSDPAPFTPHWLRVLLHGPHDDNQIPHAAVLQGMVVEEGEPLHWEEETCVLDRVSIHVDWQFCVPFPQAAEQAVHVGLVESHR
jgi:hypothetical protein